MPGLGMRIALCDQILIKARLNDPTMFPGKKRPVGCVCTGCQVPVEFRSGYELSTSGSPPKWVEAVFRLPKHSVHRTGCPYNVKATLVTFAARAENAKNLAGERLLEQLSVNQFVIRLKMLGDTYGLTPVPVSSESSEENRKRQALHNNAKRIAPYILVADLVKLYVKIRNETQNYPLEQMLQIEYGDVRIPWMQFLYEEKRRSDLFHATFWKNSQATQPFAVFITPVGKPDWPKGVRLDTRSETIAGKRYGINLFCYKSDAFDNVSIGDRYLVFAKRAWLYPNMYTLGIEVVGAASLSVSPRLPNTSE